ncbi:hypothetical protein Ddye_014542 [Dipteronia dyeriana]|uniref:Cytochrome P450 n=1 Tax=Dipteronia dyeriana TaxID=168575 RepID=A0AAE0CKP9_9ROSI|nr:hypothetical protein Ddye_014542 [Dipteronia dyeriana]
MKSFSKPHHNTRPISNPPPPSPPALPIIGHLHLIGKVLPKSLQTLAHCYGPLLQLRLGASTCVVASTADVAKEIFKNQELNFCSRPEFGSSEYFIYRGSRFAIAQYGDYWRFMKKLCMTRLLSVPLLDKFADESVMKCCIQGQPCDLTTEFTALTNNTICRMAMSTRCSGKVNEAEVIRGLTRTCLQIAGKVIVGDVLGPLKIFDFSGNGNKLKSALLKYDRIVEKVLKEHEEKVVKGNFDPNQRKDLMDILLEDIFIAGTDTSSIAMQWAMGELINHPTAFKKLRDEINTVVGPNRLVKESDTLNLPYLRAVIKEILRLHPSAKTRVLVYVYAVMRDPELWAHPDEFMPERFLEGSGERFGEHRMEFKGQNFRFLPFGSGRRGCPGASLAMVVMHTAVGAMVQCFDWKLKGGDEKVDMSQGPGFASEMAHPLVLYPIKHMQL